ncbi:hypothetical protein CDIK_3090 [Cucumispora dikerogammari]|nr:hypothetical protein CDIK_3090 [Cucumispora dikerogammari]
MFVLMSVNTDNVCCEAPVTQTTSEQLKISTVNLQEPICVIGENEASISYSFIETVIDFIDPSFIEIYSITEDSIKRSLKILMINSEHLKHNNPAFHQTPESCMSFSEIFNDIKIECSQIRETTQFVLSFRTKTQDSVNPIIRYFENNPMVKLKLSLVFPRPLSEGSVYEDLMSVIKQLEAYVQPLQRLLEQDMETIRKSIVGPFETIKSLYDAWPSTENRITDEIYSMLPNNISKKLQKKMISALAAVKPYLESRNVYLSSKQKILLAKFKKQIVSKSLINEQIRTKINEEIMKNSEAQSRIYKKFIKNKFSKILEGVNVFLIKTINGIIRVQNISTLNKNIILQAFNDELKNHTEDNFCFLTLIFENIKNKMKAETKSLVLDAFVFKLNKENSAYMISSFCEK